MGGAKRGEVTLRKAGNLMDRYDYLDDLEDFLLDTAEYVEIAHEAFYEDGEEVDLEAFLEARYPDVLREFEGQYEKDRREIENVA